MKLNTRTLFAVVVVICALSFCLCACSDSLDAFEGEWVQVGVSTSDGTIQPFDEIGIDAPEYIVT